MDKDPAFLLYSKDWIQGTAQLFPAEKGVYIDLLAHQHQDGFLPSDSKRLAKMVGLSHDEFLKLWDALKDKFEEKNGKLYNAKLASIINNRSEHGEMRAIIGTFGQLMKKLVCSKDEEAFIRKSFNYNDFSGVDKANLSKIISKWLSNCLATHGNGNGNGNEDYNINRYWFLKFYKSTYSDYKKIFNGQSCDELYFDEWKKFIDKIYEKKFEEIFECKFLSPHDFAKLVLEENFKPDEWEPVLKSILATGIKPEHNLFFRIPQFLKYHKKDKNGEQRNNFSDKSVGSASRRKIEALRNY